MPANPHLKPGHPLNRDALMMIPRDTAATVAHKALFPIQNMDPHEQVAGAAILFAQLCDRLALDPAEMHDLGLKLLRPEPHHVKGNGQIESLRDFVGLRLAGQEVVAS